VVGELQEESAQLQGAIIAAGSGERLRRSGDDIPKPLVKLGGETLLARQARAMMRAGARSVIAIVNSETAGIIDREKIALPNELSLMVRDTANSMESLLALGEVLPRENFLLATVDAVIADAEFAKFIATASSIITKPDRRGFDSVLGVVEWRGDKRPLFAKISDRGEIVALGDDQTPMVTAGVYLLPARIFDFADAAKRAELSALRRFLAMLIDKGLRLGAVELADTIDIDEAADLAAARATVKERR
jgi:choline kinase